MRMHIRIRTRLHPSILKKLRELEVEPARDPLSGLDLRAIRRRILRKLLRRVTAQRHSSLRLC